MSIHLAFLGASRQSESDLPYGNIVALNENAATLHYQLQLPDAPAQHHSLLIDAGATCRGYASDITRTYAAKPGLFASLIEGMHDAAAGTVRARCPRLLTGASCTWPRTCWFQDCCVMPACCAFPARMRSHMGISSTFLPHGLGHLLGLQVHDVGGFRSSAQAPPIARPPGHNSLRLTRLLETGMVVTVEPGVYFIDSLLQSLRAGAARTACGLVIDRIAAARAAESASKTTCWSRPPVTRTSRARPLRRHAR